MNETAVEDFMRDLNRYFPYEKEAQRDRASPSMIVKADPENISKAKKFISKLDAFTCKMWFPYNPVIF